MPCRYQIILPGGNVRCEWLSERMGSAVLNALKMCQECMMGGPANDRHATLDARLTLAIEGRVIAWNRPDSQFGGMTCEQALRRLVERGVSKARLRDAIVASVERWNMPDAMARSLGAVAEL